MLSNLIAAGFSFDQIQRAWHTAHHDRTKRESDLQLDSADLSALLVDLMFQMRSSEPPPKILVSLPLIELYDIHVHVKEYHFDNRAVHRIHASVPTVLPSVLPLL